MTSSSEHTNLVPIGEACHRLGGISRTTLWRMMVRGEVVGVTVGRRRTMIVAASIEEYVVTRAAETGMQAQP